MITGLSPVQVRTTNHTHRITNNNEHVDKAQKVVCFDSFDIFYIIYLWHSDEVNDLGQVEKEMVASEAGVL